MEFNLALLILSFVYLFLIIGFYFSKRRIKNFENKIYVVMLVIDVICIVFEFFCLITAKFIWPPTIFSLLMGRLFLVSVVTWISLFVLYLILITSKKPISEMIHNGKYKIIGFGSYIILIILMMTLPMKYFTDGKIAYSTGLSVNVLVGVYIVSLLFSIIKIIINFNHMPKKKLLPSLIFCILVIMVAILKVLAPGMQIVSTALSFVTILMFFTIENPDMKMIEQLNYEKDRADQANNAKSEFLSNMSHEIRTPLNAIVGFSQTLIENESLPDSAKNDAKDIMAASESLVELVNGILDISKIEANKLEIVESEYKFKKVFETLVSLTRGRMGDKPLDFRFTYDESIPPVLYGDHARLKQIVLNLLTNSVKYTKEGYIIFKVSSVIKDNVCRLIISVEDSGIGIKKENIDKLFTKFERLGVEKNTTIEGTGLGLAITKKLVELMNGKIVVQSVYGQGSKFTVAIDQIIVANPTNESLENTSVINTEKILTYGKKVLIVDDNKINLKVGARLLQTYGVEIDEVERGQECIDKINFGATYDLILMDDMMPNMSGTETLHKLREKADFKIPVIALTANAVSGMKEKYLSEGFDDYLAKPIEKPELARVVKKYLT